MKKQLLKHSKANAKSICKKLVLSTTLFATTFTNAQNTSYNIDNNPLTGGNECTAFGYKALFNNTGNNNDAVGVWSLFKNTTGYHNTAHGYGSLQSNIDGYDNVAVGFHVLMKNVHGYNNVAVGTQALQYNEATDNTAVGHFALAVNTTGSGNVAVGSAAMLNNTGDDNTALGTNVLQNNTGKNNTGAGRFSLVKNTTGIENSAYGYRSLFNNISGSYNCAIGIDALYSNTTGSSNTALGAFAMYNGSNGAGNVAVGRAALHEGGNTLFNTAIGYQALYNTSLPGDYGAHFNTAVGAFAMESNINGCMNVAIGDASLYDNVDGNWNTSIGNYAMFSNISGSDNSALGISALTSNMTGNQCAAVGSSALFMNVSGDQNSGFGSNADVTSGNLKKATALGAFSLVNANNRVWIGSVTDNVWCQFGAWNTSDQRFKTNIKEDDVKGLDFIKLLRPVAYNFDTKKLTQYMVKDMPDSVQSKYIENRDFETSTNVRRSGFLAQEVEAAAKQAGYDFSGVHVANGEHDTYGLSYAEFVVPLVKAVQEQQAMIEKDQATINKLQNQIESLLQKTNGTSNPSMNSKNIENTNELGISNYASMEQNEPNPFSHETVIKYNLPKTVGSAIMYVYDLSGKQFSSFPINDRGTSSITITSDNLAAGIYIYNIVADGKIVDSKRMVVANK